MKTAFKGLIVAILAWQVKRLRKKHDVKIIAVVGSVGKTSTKLAIARLLCERYRVRFQEGNYNDIVSVPLVFFNQYLPTLLNPIAWAILLIKNEVQLLRVYPYDVVVLELGTDGPGQLAKFRKYLAIDLLVVTAIAEEHMEFFETLESVAQEELSPQTFSKQVLINTDLCPGLYKALYKPNSLSYGIHNSADYQIKINAFEGSVYNFVFLKHEQELLSTTYKGVSDVELYSVGAALAAADYMQIPVNELKTIRTIKPFSGRMQQLAGIKDSLIIDDTYNASPLATKSALDTLYKLKAQHKIAILGSMNELGNYSAEAHSAIGAYCDPNILELVVTIGSDANQFLAPAATKRGCTVKSFDDPYAAGRFVRDSIQSNTIVLAKGSQNGVFAEEAVKLLLVRAEDANLLVRQSPAWLKKKRLAFKNKEHTS
jgi:UDP-N-acetylmuramoyl-tripeptide--D-alanyl-D-alanine ligase